MSPGARRVGPFLLWRGYVHTPCPWPRLMHADVIGWVLSIDTLCVGVQWRGSSR